VKKPAEVEIDPLLADFYSEINPVKKEETAAKIEPVEVKEPEKPVEPKPKEKDPLLDNFYSEVI
jgi:hypothetical protein